MTPYDNDESATPDEPWSTTPPTEPGWYWVKLRGNNFAECARVDMREAVEGLRVAVFGDDFWYPLADVELWGPRLVPPPLPEEEQRP